MTSPCITDASSLPSQSPLTFIIDVCGVLKRLKRTGWVKHKVPSPESDADHMHRVALCSMLYHNHENYNHDHLDYSTCPELHPSRIDATKLLRMAVTHDLCEAIAGDVTPHCAHASTREQLEQQAMEHIARIVGGSLGQELAALWKEYEEQMTPTAIIVKDLDKFEMLAQAYEYEEAYLKDRADGVDPLQDSRQAMTAGIHSSDPPSVCDEPMRDFFQRQQGKMKTPLFQKLDAELRERRIKMLELKGWKVTAGEM